MGLMMFQIMKLKIARSKMLPQPLWVPEHSQIAVTNLRDSAVRPRLKHIPRNKRRLHCLHRLVPQYPRLPVMPNMSHIL